jgi:signal transduction histidine kinase
METANRWMRSFRIVLCGAGTLFLFLENHPVSWLRVFLLFLFLTAVLLDGFLPVGTSFPVRLPALLQGVMVLLVAASAGGYGSCFLAFAALEALSRRFRNPAAFLPAAFLLLANALLLVRASGWEMTSALPASGFLFAGACLFLALSAIRDMEQQREKDLAHFSELQHSRKELADVNRQLASQREDLECLAVLRERDRMSKQIHDTVGHTLTAITAQLGAAERLAGDGRGEAVQKIINARLLAREGLDSIKTSLVRIDGDQRLFGKRIRSFADKAETDMGIRILTLLDAEGTFPESIRQFLFDSFREGITNGVRHGKATAFVFRLSRTDGQILFHLEDNGTGCVAPKPGYGLTAIRETAGLLDGTLVLHSVADEGFTMDITIPCREDAT